MANRIREMGRKRPTTPAASPTVDPVAILPRPLDSSADRAEPATVMPGPFGASGRERVRGRRSAWGRSGSSAGTLYFSLGTLGGSDPQICQNPKNTRVATMITPRTIHPSIGAPLRDRGGHGRGGVGNRRGGGGRGR